MQISDFPKTWIGTDLSSKSELTGSTYYEFPLQSLPTVDNSDDLNWLTQLHPEIMREMEPFRPGKEERQAYAKNAKAILAQAEQLGLSLPSSFKTLIQSKELQDRFPSFTACYFDLPDKIVPAPFGLDGHIIRFLNDQQTCVQWYLYLPASGVSVVLAAYQVEDVFFLEELEGQAKRLSAQAAKAAYVAADSFPQFLRRYWIENCIQYKNLIGLDLTTTESKYFEGV